MAIALVLVRPERRAEEGGGEQASKVLLLLGSTNNIVNVIFIKGLITSSIFD